MSKANYSIDLIKQMAEYDANYIRLLKLVPQLHAYRDKSFDEFIDASCEEISKNLRPNEEPEKVLEGLTTEFCIADLKNSN